MFNLEVELLEGYTYDFISRTVNFMAVFLIPLFLRGSISQKQGGVLPQTSFCFLITSDFSYVL
jgi:hypothetical protein